MPVRDPNCTACPLHKDAKTVCLPGNGTGANRIFIVGEAPGANEDEQGEPFVGQSGAFLNRALTDFAELNRAECFVTNAVKCRPKNNKTPDRKTIKTCSDLYIDEEVRAKRPKYMLVMGNSALLGVLGKSGIMKQRGTVTTLDFGEGDEVIPVKVMPTIHPAAVLRNPKWGVEFALDLRRFGHLVRGRSVSPKTRVKIINTPEQLAWLRDKLLKAKEISWDLETYTEDAEEPYIHTNFQYWHENESHITSIAFTWQEELSAVIPLWHIAGPWRKHVQRVLTYLAPALERSDCKYDLHNGKYDVSWAKAFGVNALQTFDTMLASHILDENRIKGLKDLARSQLGADGYDVGEELENSHEMPIKRLCVYNGKDSDYTFRLAKHFRRELRKTENADARRLYTKLLMPASRAFVDIEASGVYIDPQRWQERHDKAQENVAVLHKYVERSVPADMRPINLRSSQQVAKLLYTHFELPVTKKTKTGAASTAEGVLLRLGREHTEITALLKYRKWYKYLSTYILPWWFKHRGADGRIHSSYKIGGTVTGRLSGEGGIQQVPRDPFIRSIIGAQPGWELLEADYSMIELRIAAMLANETRMLRQFTNGEDIHALRAMRITGKTASEITKEERSRAKAVSFGFIYGMGAKKFVDYAFEEYEVIYTLEESKALRNGFFTDYPTLLPWHNRQRRIANRYREVRAPHGRIRRLPDILSDDEKIRGEVERQGINAPVQVLASDIMLASLIELHKILPPKKARIVASVHDSIMFEVKEGHAAEYAPLIRQVMQDTKRFERQFKCEITVPIKVDIEIGSHWGEGKEFNETAVI